MIYVERNTISLRELQEMAGLEQLRVRRYAMRKERQEKARRANIPGPRWVPQWAPAEDQLKALRSMVDAAAILMDQKHHDEARRQAQAALVALLRCAYRVATGRPHACPKFPQALPKRLYGKKVIDLDTRRHLTAALAGKKQPRDVVYFCRQLLRTLSHEVDVAQERSVS